MSEEFDEEALKKQFLSAVAVEPKAEPTRVETQDAVDAAVKQVNVQTGSRDMAVLFVTSLFSILLVLFAPVATAIARKKDEQSRL